jgi:hypothetical protein
MTGTIETAATAIRNRLMRMGPFSLSGNPLFIQVKIPYGSGLDKASRSWWARKYKKRGQQLRPRSLHFQVKSLLLADAILQSTTRSKCGEL